MEEMCRYTTYNVPVAIFNVFTCSMCYNYLFHDGTVLTQHQSQPWILVPSQYGADQFPPNFTVMADISNSTSRDMICNTLSGSYDCQRWTACCQAASACCLRQLSRPKINASTSASGGPGTKSCPRTWDGYGCFGDTPASTRTYISCPRYVEHASTSETAYKDCTENGTWWVNPQTHAEWTNYTTCVKKQDFHTVVYVALACNFVSLLLLTPACIIFLAIRQLRAQNRIRLHVCLFSAFILESLVTVTWDLAVYLDRLDNEREDTVMYSNSGWCKLLYILTRYVSTANFFWMFCEGFYLHRLIVHAFAPPKTLIPYYIFGWVVALVPASIYAIIRATKEEYNKSCWVHNIGATEWLLYTPNIVTLGVNVLFLGNILRILCSKLQAHHNEPNNYRKALRATFVLVPLFGLQQFLVIYRIPPGTTFALVYDIIQTVIKSTKGAVVALIFCFCNGEVHTYLRNAVRRHMKFGSSSDYNRKNSMTSNTQITSFASTRRPTKPGEIIDRDRGYIPLSTSSTANDITTTTSPTNGHVTFAC